MPSGGQLEILGIIPARGGSKAVKRKNVRLLAGQPLISYTIEAARGSRELTRYICSTDDDEIAGLAESLGSAVLRRPPELAGDATPMQDVVHHVLESLCEQTAYVPDIFVILQPTAPLRTSAHIDEAIKTLMHSKADALVSVARVPAHYHPDWQFVLDSEMNLKRLGNGDLRDIVTRRQELSPTYTRNGAIYACWFNSFRASASFYGKTCIGYPMDPEDSVNIDSEEDLRLAELRLTARKDQQ